MNQEPEFVSFVKGCFGCLLFVLIAFVIGSLVVQAVGLGTVVFFVVSCAIVLGVVWYQWSTSKKGE
ncbi:hypothetical protein [Streptomyces capillispiralis]|uniref:Uncharacterized protein n=1 Tax=Streptomyces capillispiralis TaxID=68182 RepID=A0A561TDP2_9ACTN|nr:hypothetical protein [Streptomyces capillispiralis]TWF85232.1 hypothetical protein FHX78_112182 [Streptomyces capillispiralis]GHH90358.1 hypothetical protein GCM10017779_08150 [Streptomyces capillispiralis]